MRTKLSFAPAEKLRLVKAEEGYCVKCGLQLTESNPPTGSYAYKTAAGSWVTGQLCKNCANKPKTDLRGVATRYDYYNEKRMRAITLMQGTKPLLPKRKKRKHVKRKKRGPYGTGNSEPVKEFLAELKKPVVQRFGKEKTWKTHWATDPELRQLFKNSYRGTRSFASSFGYNVGNVEELKRHKRNITKREEAGE